MGAEKIYRKSVTPLLVWEDSRLLINLVALTKVDVDGH